MLNICTTVAAYEIRNNHLLVYKQTYSLRRLCDMKSCICMQKWLNNLEPVTSHQEIERCRTGFFQISYATAVLVHISQDTGAITSACHAETEYNYADCHGACHCTQGPDSFDYFEVKDTDSWSDCKIMCLAFCTALNYTLQARLEKSKMSSRTTGIHNPLLRHTYISTDC